MRAAVATLAMKRRGQLRRARAVMDDFRTLALGIGYNWRVLALATCLSVVLTVPGNPQQTRPVTRRLYEISVGEHSGYIDSTGKVIVPPCFDQAWQFSEGLAVVRVGGLYGYIDTLGDVVIRPQFEWAQSFSEGLAQVGTSTKSLYIDRTGRIAIEANFDAGSPSAFHDGRASASIGGVKGYIDRRGTMVIRSESHSYHPDFSNGLAAIEVGGQWGFIDTTGTMVIKPQFPRDFNSAFGPGRGFRHGLAAVPIGDKWGFIDKAGRVVIPAQFDSADPFEDGLARVRVGTQWGYIDTTGAFVIAPQFANTWGFSEGLAAVRIGDKWGYVDRAGRLVIAPQFEPDNRFDYVGGFWGGIARARRGDESGYIDRTGRFVWTSRQVDPRTAASGCPAALAQQPTPALPAQTNVDTAALPAVSPLPQPSGRTQADTARPILYYEEVNGEPVLTGLYLDGRRVVVPADNAATIPMWSPDGAWLAYSTVDSAAHAGVLAVVNLRGERHRLLVTRDSLAAFPRWSPDGRLIAALLVTRDESAEPKLIPLVVVGVVDNAVRSRVSIPVAALAARVQPTVSWSPDGLKILVAGEIAIVVTIATGVIDTISQHLVTAQWGSTADAVYYFAQSDSARPGTTEALGAFFVRRLADRQSILLAAANRVATLGAPFAFAPLSRRLILSPDGKRLALWGRVSGDAQDVVRLYDMSAGNVIDLDKPSATFRQAGMIVGLQWGPQGRGLAALVATEQGLEVQYLDVGSGRWKKLASVRAGGAADYYGFGILSLSWTQ